jgi:phage tail sheath protein FI
MEYKTPGVYVTEITTFPPSVVPVETAIPAFIGYTEKAVDAGGTTLRFVPTRITSLLEFETSFGADFLPAAYDVTLDTANANAIGSVTPRDAASNERHYYLYGCLRHFYANGGGPCYIVSVGSYSDAPELGNTTTPAGLLGGLARLERFDEPTLLVFPDGVTLSASNLGSLQVAALAQSEKLQDRFVIMDLRQGFLAASLASNPIASFRQEVGISNLKYGAAYYPWVRTIYRPAVHFRHLHLLDTASAPIPNATLDQLTQDAATDALVPAVRAADATVMTVVNAVNISSMAGPSSLSLNRGNFPQLANHFAALLGLLHQSGAATPAATIRQVFSNLLLLPRAIALAFQTLDTATLPNELDQAVTQLRQDTELVTAIVRLIALEKNTDVMGSVSPTRTVADVESSYAALNTTGWITPHVDIAAIPASTDALAGANERETALNAASVLQAPFDKLAAAILAVFAAAEFLADEAEKQLFDRHPVFRDVAEQVKRTMSLLPISGAVAGVYAAVDRTRGVWKAPANVALVDVSGPAVKINDAAQADLNVNSTGKSVNAIRAFTGKGTLVWGARTLAGNDNEWRYISVRRFFNMAEESIKKATEPFVFEPNDANTWVRVRAMIENFLTVQWRQGALAGATPVQAFYVKVGLGETMTAQDILEGRMIVEVGMAVVRPAEFIILKFAHKMQVS